MAELIQILTRLIDRTRIITYQVCPRKRWYEFEFEGRGVQLKKLSVPLTVGIHVHDGLAVILQSYNGLTPGVKEADEGIIELAVKTALEAYDKECLAREFKDLDELGDHSFAYRENRACIEALIRVWAKVRLPRFLEEYEILAVEEEGTWEIVEGSTVRYECSGCKYWRDLAANENVMSFTCPDCHSLVTVKGSDGITFMFRPDALVRERSTGEIHIISFKTSAGKYDDNQNKWDVQGLSEMIGVEKNTWTLRCLKCKSSWVSQDNEEVYKPCARCGGEDYVERTPIKVSAIKMEYLIKGSYIKNENLSNDIPVNAKYYNNGLLHPWMRTDSLTGVAEFAFNYKWTDEQGKNHTLGKGWNRINIYDQGEGVMKQWIELLENEPPNKDGLMPLETFIGSPQVYKREKRDLDNWIEQVKYQEGEIQNAVEFIQKQTGELPQERMRLFLNQHFPQYRHSCFAYNSNCQFVGICWEGLRPQDRSTYEPRRVNHLIERERFPKEEESKGYKSKSFNFHRSKKQ